jgi:prepilin-type N-terminal cleavage/methylation domain-containing protein
MRKAFTLLETIITLIIIGLLAVVLTESYLTITKTAFKIEQEKNLTEETLMLTQILESITDTATIDYEEYASSLSGLNGFTGVLYLTGGQRSGVSIYSTGKCLDLVGNEFAMSETDTYPDPAEVIFQHS